MSRTPHGRSEPAHPSKPFVGREHELALLVGALSGNGANMFYVYGPAGIGKTSLLQAFAAEAQHYPTKISCIDARDLVANVTSVVTAIERAQVAEPHDSSEGTSHVLLIDTYEHLKEIEPLIRRELLRRIPSTTLLVIAGRVPPTAEWLTLSSAGRVIVLKLGNLSPVEARRYLAVSGIESQVALAIIEFTHGHPLGLDLAIEACRRAPDSPFLPERAPDLITTLYQYFIEQNSDPAKRSALEISAILHTTSEMTLGVLFEGDVAKAFQWLRELNFMKIGQRGIFPHDLIREVIVAELRWRNPDSFARLIERALCHCYGLMNSSSGARRLEAMYDFIFTAGQIPQLAWLAKASTNDSGESFVLDELKETDKPVLADAVLRYEGPTSVQHLQYWFERRPSDFHVVRGAEGVPLAFVAYLHVDHISAEERNGDPVLCKVWDYAREQAGGDPDGRIRFCRFLMECETYQQQSSPGSAICARITIQDLLDGIIMGFLRLRQDMEPNWRALYTGGGGTVVSELQHKIDEHIFEIVFHHFPDTSDAEVFMAICQRLVSNYLDPPILAHCSTSSLAALTLEDFCMYVREALHSLHDPLALANNLLIGSKAVKSRMPPHASSRGRADALKALLIEEAELLRGIDSADTLYRVLDAAYLNPVGKHEFAAEMLNKPYSTFRRIKNEAIKRIARSLYDRELSPL